MILERDFALLYLIFTLLLGAILFVFGFFPTAYSSDARAEFDDIPNFIDDIPLNKSVYEGHISRTTLMVIDALRTDFIQHQENKSMKYLNKLINDGSACMVNLEVETPTVTMPRIKAMTTGTVPNFIDIILNLGNTEINIDSLLHQTYDKGKKIVFCGDDTWVKMFPEMFHRKMENRDSLFVNDFYEGDKNITQKLSAELKRSDWELLILHYLGLDHIGHVEGPLSAKVAPKLREMDTVTMHIHLAMLDWMKTSAKPPLLVVTGDHGMRDTGGHGGSSYAETHVPFVFVGLNCRQDDEKFKQIDISPTLSVLLGLPIPASSIGIIIPNFLANLTMEQKLFAYFYNGKRLLNKLIDLEEVEQIQNKEFYIQFHDAMEAHKFFMKTSSQSVKHENLLAFKRAELQYISSAKEMSELLTKSFVTFDNSRIFIGMAAITSALIAMGILNVISARSINIPIRTIFFVAPISCAIGHKMKFLPSSLFEMKNITHNFMTLNCLYNSIVAAVFIISFIDLLEIIRTIKQFKKIKSVSGICNFLLFGVTFQTVSYISSSFIEEEHHTWYYLNATAFLILYVLDTRHLLTSRKQNQQNEAGRTTFGDDSCSLGDSQLKWFLLFICHFVARNLNQTGDKWSHLPDIGDWLVMIEHISWNSLFSGISIILVYINCMQFGNILTNVISFTLGTLIYHFHALNGSVHFTGVKINGSPDACLYLFWLGVVEIIAVNYLPVVLRFFFANSFQRGDIKVILGTNIIIGALIMSLLFKSHNIFLIAILLFTCNKLKYVCAQIFEKKADSMANLLIQCILHVWIGKEFFFYQGNSNSLATIDLHAGYVGLKEFNLFIVGIFLTLSTYSGPILTFLVFMYNLYDFNDPQEQHSHLSNNDRNHRTVKRTVVTKENALYLLAILFALPFVLYTYFILLFRQHIFIWSVFAPKLIYEFYSLNLMFSLWMCMYVLPY